MSVWSRLRLGIIACIITGFIGISLISAGDAANKPRMKNTGAKFRIAYCETESFANYAATFYHLVQGLAKLGWLTNVEGLPYTPGQKDTQVMWAWLATRDVSPYLEFVSDGFYTYNAQIDNRIAVRQNIIARLNQDKDIDLIIAMGTWPGQDLATSTHRVPTVVFSTSNAVQSGIIDSISDSGRDHVWAHIDPWRYRRQLEVFHDIFRFKTVGIVYEDTVMGRSVAAIEDVEAVAKERGFTVVRRCVDDRTRQGDQELYFQQALAAHQELAAEVDAMYLTLYSHRAPDMLPVLLEPFYDKRIPVFAQQWTTEVQYGALLSVAAMDFSGIGQFGAEAIARILIGEQPRSIPQVFESTPHIVLNIHTAEHIGWTVPVDIIFAADQVYH